MPGLRSDSLKIWTFPAFGQTGAGSGDWEKRDEQSASDTSAASLNMGPSLELNRQLH